MEQKISSMSTDILEGHNLDLPTEEEIIENEINAKSVSLKAGHTKTETEENHHDYRFELVPDHHYSHQAVHDEPQLYSEEGETFSKKLEGAYILENCLSRMTATLFISCWESLKSLSNEETRTLYHRLEETPSYRSIHNESTLKDFIENLSNSESERKNTEINLIEEKTKSMEEVKNEILERQKRGFTLDSLDKIKEKRSKSKEHFNVPKETKIPNANNEMHHQQHFTGESTFERLLKNPKYTKKEFIPQEFQSTNISSFPSNPFSVLSSYKNQFNESIHQHTNNLVHEKQIKDEREISNEKEELERIRFLAEIVNKLQFSKLRMESRQPKTSYDFEIIRRILRLEKAVKDLKLQQSERKKVISHAYPQSNVEYKDVSLKNFDLTEENTVLKRLLEEITLIRSEIDQIKEVSPSRREKETSSTHNETTNNFIFGKKTDLSKTIENSLIKTSDASSIKEKLILAKGTEEALEKTVNTAQKKSSNNLSLSSSQLYRKVHTYEIKEQIYEFQEKQIREQQVKIMVENVKKRRYEQSITNYTDFDRSQPIRGRFEKDWKILEEERQKLRSEDDNCCVLMDF